MHGNIKIFVISYLFMFNIYIYITILHVILGSGESHIVYFYRRLLYPSPPAFNPMSPPIGMCAVTFPVREHVDGDLEETVHCAIAFRDVVVMAAGSSKDLAAHTNALAQEHLNRKKADRDKKCPIRYSPSIPKVSKI